MTQRDAEGASRELYWRELVLQLTTRLLSEESLGNLQETNVKELFDNELCIDTHDGILSVWLDFESGNGSWNAASPRLVQCEPWFMNAEGEVLLSGEIIDLGTLVDRFVSKLAGD